MLVSNENYPNILEAMHCIEQDTGNTLAFPVKDVPARWEEYLPKIEDIIGNLSRKERAPEEPPLPPHVKPSELLDSEFYSFCNGEHDAMVAMSNRSPDHMLAHIFLYDFFEDWTYTSDSGSDTPLNSLHQRRIEYLEMVERESGLGLTEEQEQELAQRRAQIA